jgi:hypothetical protein
MKLVALKMTYRTMKKKNLEKKKRKSENPRFYGQNKHLLWHPTFG